MKEGDEVQRAQTRECNESRDDSRAEFHVGDFVALFLAVLLAVFASVGIVFMVVMPP